MKALILVNGELYRPDVLRSRIRTETFDLVLGADRGAHYANTLYVALDVVIGDLDSLTDLERQDIGNPRFITYPTEKNETDLELALRYAKKQGADNIVLVGVMGGRMDMTIGNILLITHENLSSCRVEVWHGEQTGWVIKPPGEYIPGYPGDTVSLIPLSGNALGITTEGLKYPLKDEELTFGSVRGISNLMNKSSAHIKLSDGLLLAVHTPSRS
jgi:thiamine pyrophosphokinase